MPFVQIMGLDCDKSQREALAREATAALVRTLDVSPDSVTIYFAAHDPSHYAHGGQIEDPSRRRIFVNLHILARSEDMRRQTATALCDVIATLLRHDPQDIAIYFLERLPSEVSHAGLLESDRLALEVKRNA